MDYVTMILAVAERLGEARLEAIGLGRFLTPMAAGFDRGFLNTVQDSFGKLEVESDVLRFLGLVFGTVLTILIGYLLRSHYKKLHYHLLAMFAGKARLEDNRRILEYLGKAESTLEMHQGDGKRSRYLGEGKVVEVRPAEFVLQVETQTPNVSFPTGRMLTLYFRPIKFRGKQFNNFSTYLEHVSQPGSREYRLRFHAPMSIAYQRRRNHARYDIERQSLVKGKVWLARWADGRSPLRFQQPLLRINMDGPEDARVHDISAGGLRLVLPRNAGGAAYKPDADLCMQLFLYNPAKGNYRWIWLGAKVTKTFRSSQGLNVCLRFAALGSLVNAEEGEMRWHGIGVAEGLPGMNQVIGEWKAHLAGEQEKGREALA